MVVALLVWLRARAAVDRLGLGLVLGGAVGNVIDRVRFGAVVDFLDFHALGYHWPAFNVADSAICIGAALLLVDGCCCRAQPLRLVRKPADLRAGAGTKRSQGDGAGQAGSECSLGDLAAVGRLRPGPCRMPWAWASGRPTSSRWSAARR